MDTTIQSQQFVLKRGFQNLRRKIRTLSLENPKSVMFLLKLRMAVAFELQEISGDKAASLDLK